MSTWARFNGALRLRDCPECRGLVERLKQELNELEVLDHFDLIDRGGQITIEFYAWGDTSYGHESDIRSTIEALSPFCLEAGRVETASDVEATDVFYVGSTEQQEEGASRDVVRRVLELAQELTQKDLQEVVGSLDGLVEPGHQAPDAGTGQNRRRTRRDVAQLPLFPKKVKEDADG